MMFGHIRNAKIEIKAAKKHFEDNSSGQKTHTRANTLKTTKSSGQRHCTCAPPVVALII
jgi:hypothetical protein